LVHAAGGILHTLVVAFWLTASGGPAGTAGFHGTTTTQNHTVRLPGVEVVVNDATSGRRVAAVVSDGSGRFAVRGLPPGRYRVVARFAGFTDLSPAPMTLADGQDQEIDLDLALAPVTEDVKVIAQAGLAQTETSVSRDTVKGHMNEFLPVAGDGYRALLPIMPGVVRAPDGRISLKGARETQGALQVGRGYANDPSTGNFGIELPADSIDSVDVLPNPYAAEDGRFSSTVVRIETRAGSNQWHGLVNGFVPIPCLRLCDGASMGIRNYRPRGWFGGPIVKDRLFISQGVQYRFARVRVPGLPEAANDTTDHGLETFTRLDANVAAGHTLTATAALFPRRAQSVGLNTFTPSEAAPDYRLMGYSVAVADSATLSAAAFVESSLTATVYHADVSGHGEAPEELTVDGTRGNFFNTQSRRTHTVQWAESVSGSHHSATGEHLLRAGVDVMWAAYSGNSDSRPVIVRRADGTVSQRFDFGPGTAQQVSGTDVAAFLQDRWRVSRRLLFEPGLRVDRDGVIRRTNLSPRIGTVVGLLGDDVGVLRGGIGVFYERTPLNVGAFKSFETVTLTRFAADGVTPASAPIAFVPDVGSPRTPRSVIWNVEYDHRVGSNVFLKVNHLERRGTGIAIVEPVESGSVTALRLDSTGRSFYAETEISLRYGVSELQQLSVAYVRSHSTGNLNAFDTYFGNFRTPIVRPDQYALSSTDVPNRVLIRGVLTVRKKWTFSTLVEMRNGFPYSLIDQEQQFVGIRNAGGRFPNLYTVDLSIIRSVKLLGREIRFGVRGYHLLNNFAPRDVQNNIDSPAFGTFYNPIPRRLAVTFTFLPR
jgi:hypothetical protein